MKTRIPHSRSGAAGFTMIEIMVSMTIVITVMALTMTTFLYGLRIMYKDNQRLATNATLRYFMAQISKETLDASEFYIFPGYASLNGAVNLETDVAVSKPDRTGTPVYHGDCIVLVTRTSLADGAPVRRYRVYYRVVKDSWADATGSPLRYFASPDFGTDGSKLALNDLLNDSTDGVNLLANEKMLADDRDPKGHMPTSSLLATRARGRPETNYDDKGIKTLTGSYYPIFSSDFPTVSKTNENVSINVEIINGTTLNNLLSSSSFNYTISPRR